MSVGKIEVTPEELRKISSEVTVLVEKYKENYTGLYDVIKSIKDTAAWDGDDHAAFVEQIELFKKEFIEMEKDMEHYADFLNKAANAYSGIQTHVTDLAGKRLKVDA